MEIKVVYTKDDFKGLHDILNNNGKKSKIKKFWWGIGALTIWSLIILMIVRLVSDKDVELVDCLPLIGFIIALGLYGLVLFMKCFTNMFDNITWKKYQYKGRELKYSFLEEKLKVELIDAIEDSIIYDRIIRICETENIFYLFLGKNMFHMIPKRVLNEDEIGNLRSVLAKYITVEIEVL